MDEPTRQRACLLFAAMAHPARIRIVELLFEGEKPVGEVAKALGISQSSASQHLAQLARAGLITYEARGKSHAYRVRGPRIEKIVSLIAEFCQVHGLFGSEFLALDQS